jgi:hypothetical protein
VEGDVMDEREWMERNNLGKMLDFLESGGSERKWRLFACACCRRIWHLLSEQWERSAIEVGERYADELASSNELNRALRSLPASSNPADLAATYAVFSDWQGSDHVAQIAGYAVGAVRYVSSSRERQTKGEAEERGQAFLLHDLFGNPFRPVALNPAWRTPTVLALATAAYDHRILPSGRLEPDRLAVLADALEEAGCDNADLLSHLRGNGAHVRGCWAVDLALGRE